MSAELTERLLGRARQLDNAGDGLGYYSRADAILDQKAAEYIANLSAERDGWLRIVGQIAAQVPIPDMLKATGTAADLIAYFKAQQSELADLRAAREATR